MERANILNKQEFLTKEERKQPLYHSCEHLQFETCLDLSEPIKVIPFGTTNKVSLEQYSKDVASFISWWTYFVRKDLNGFSGFHNVKFVPVGFTIV
jgi:hypothetical protein